MVGVARSVSRVGLRRRLGFVEESSMELKNSLRLDCAISNLAPHPIGKEQLGGALNFNYSVFWAEESWLVKLKQACL